MSAGEYRNERGRHHVDVRAPAPWLDRDHRRGQHIDRGLQHADALVAADISAGAVLVMQAKESVGVLAPELERGSNFQYVVHQAAASGSTMSPGSRSGPRELICLEKGCWPERS